MAERLNFINYIYIKILKNTTQFYPKIVFCNMMFLLLKNSKIVLFKTIQFIIR